VDFLLADASKAKKLLGWEPRVVFKELVKIMVDADMELVGLIPPGEGAKILRDKNILWTRNRQT
jgi:GDPmannose 4,6-dehydratase